MPNQPLLPGAQPFLFSGNAVGCLLVHGLTGTPYEMRELGQRLNGAGYTAMGIRLPGHATRYQDLDPIPWTTWSEAVEVGYETLASRCDQVVLMGMSMGAAYAFITASRRPVSGVVALSALWDFPRWQMRAARLLVHLRPYQRKRRGSSIADPAARAQHPTYDHMPMRAVLQSSLALAEMRAALPNVTVPALLVHSRRDPVAPPANVPRILAALGSADKRVHWVTRSEHIITEDYDKEEVFQTVLDWTAGVLSQPAR